MSEIKVIPVLRIFDLDKAREFYIDWLGFKIDWQHRYGDDFPVYMQVSRGDIILHLTEHHGDACPGAKVFIRFPDLIAYHTDLLARKYKYNRPGLEDAPWNAKAMEVSDPFGNRIVFHMDL